MIYLEDIDEFLTILKEIGKRYFGMVIEPPETSKSEVNIEEPRKFLRETV